MSCKEAFHICEYRWKDEVEYAETLRDRRKLWTTLLVVAVGLGVFRMDLHVDPEHVPVIRNIAVVWFIKLSVAAALAFFFFGAIHLFSSGQKDNVASKRASELLELNDLELDGLAQADDEEISTWFMIEKLRAATDKLHDANRRVSRKLKFAGVLILVGYGLLTINAVVYTLGRSFDM